MLFDWIFEFVIFIYLNKLIIIWIFSFLLQFIIFIVKIHEWFIILLALFKLNHFYFHHPHKLPLRFWHSKTWLNKDDFFYVLQIKFKPFIWNIFSENLLYFLNFFINQIYFKFSSKYHNFVLILNFIESTLNLRFNKLTGFNTFEISN